MPDEKFVQRAFLELNTNTFLKYLEFKKILMFAIHHISIPRRKHLCLNSILFEVCRVNGAKKLI